VVEQAAGDISRVPDRALQAFAARLRGSLVRPGDDQYDRAREVWNARYDRRPGLIVRCSGVADVIAAVEFAREHDVLVAVHGGGHSIVGHGSCDGGLVIDLAGLRGVIVDPERRVARVQGGALWGDFDHETAAFDLATTGGQISTTGVAGLTLGGGLGWLMRDFGLSVDNLLGVDLITAEGRSLRASADAHPDLFWALRGGGGNFGIATSLEFRLHPLSGVIGGMLIYPFERAREVVRLYQEVSVGAPDTLTLMVLLLTAPPEPRYPESIQGRPFAAIGVCYSGPLHESERVLRPIRQFGTPLLDLLRPMSYPALQRMWDVVSPFGDASYWQSPYLGPLDEAAIDTFVDQAARMTTPISGALLTTMGGAMSRVDPDATAFGHRGAPHCLEILAKWKPGGDPAPHVQWAREFAAAIRPYTCGHYMNFLADEGPDWLREAYPPATLARLAAVKAKYDPTNFFRINHNILP
jgi:FAD/FMN-containing dehydrogenase